MADMANAGEDFSKLPDIGEDLAGKIVRTGKLQLLEGISGKVPEAIVEAMRITGIAPRGRGRFSPHLAFAQ